jgi:hypothetical protein
MILLWSLLKLRCVLIFYTTKSIGSVKVEATTETNKWSCKTENPIARFKDFIRHI